MHEKYLGKWYHDEVRKIIGADKNLCPNRIIDAELNIGAMKMLITPALEKLAVSGKAIDSEKKYNGLATAARYYLSGVLCLAMKSRASTPPFSKQKYKRNWDVVRARCMEKANRLMIGLMQMG